MRFALAAVMLLGVLVVPTAARATGCDRVEPVFGVKDGGLLLEHDYCVEGEELGHFLPARIIGDFQNGSMPRLFWGGRRPDNASVIYAVTADGRLMWSRQNAYTGVLGPMVEVGHRFGGWSRYTSLMSSGRGQLFAVDERGHLIKWVHIGWLDGQDEWREDPRDLGPVCKPGAIVFASAIGPGNSVQVHGSGYSLCNWNTRYETMSTLPADALSATAAPAPGVTFALRATMSGRLMRLTLETSLPSGPVWTVDKMADASYIRVFAGNSFKPGDDKDLFKYEWQWYFYDGKDWPGP